VYSFATNFAKASLVEEGYGARSESESEENFTSVIAPALTLALFSVPRTDESCNQR